jgi:murein DD-endopeptidase MepM/ murein hydrolase activator NlpD
VVRARDARRMGDTTERPFARRRRSLRRAIVIVALALTMPAPAAGEVAASGPAAPVAAADGDRRSSGWVWPAAGFRVARPFVAPAHDYAPGHRGIDLDLLGASAVRSPARGVVAFVGSVAGRGILTIDHGAGLVTTLEPVLSDLRPGTRVARGEPVATLGRGGHTGAGLLHFGVRLNGDYINPLVLLGGVPRAVLLPCCD